MYVRIYLCVHASACACLCVIVNVCAHGAPIDISEWGVAFAWQSGAMSNYIWNSGVSHSIIWKITANLYCCLFFALFYFAFVLFFFVFFVPELRPKSEEHIGRNAVIKTSRSDDTIQYGRLVMLVTNMPAESIRKYRNSSSSWIMNAMHS